MSDSASNKRVLGILFFTVFLNLTGFSIILPLYPALLNYYLPLELQNGGLLAAVVSVAEGLAQTVGHGESSLFMTSVAFGCLLGSMYAFLQFLFAPIWGRLSDKYGRRKILKITLGGTALSSLMWFLAGSFDLFVMARVLAGVMAGNLAVATAAAADVTSKKDRTKAMGLVGAAFGLGFLFGPAIGGLATTCDLLGYFPGLGRYGVTPLAMPALISLVLNVLNYFWVSKRLGETRTVGAEKLEEKQSISAILKEEGPAIRKTNMIYFLFILAFSGLEFTLGFLAKERFSYNSVQIGYLFLYIGFVLVITQGLIIRRLTPYMGERRMAFFGLLSGVTSFVVIGCAEGVSMFYVGSGFLALSVGLASPSLSSLVSLYATEENQGKFLGLFRSAGALARAFGPLGAAALYFIYGAKSTYMLASLVLIWPIISVFFLPKPDKH